MFTDDLWSRCSELIKFNNPLTGQDGAAETIAVDSVEYTAWIWPGSLGAMPPYSAFPSLARARQ